MRAAEQLVADEGATALTMRRLADIVDVTPTTIYWHVGSRDRIVDELIERWAARHAQESAATVAPEGTNRTERAMVAITGIWTATAASPGLAELAYRSGRTRDLHTAAAATLAQVLGEDGRDRAAVADGITAIFLCVAGFLVGRMEFDDDIDTARIDEVFDRTMRAVVADIIGHEGTDP